MPVWTIKANGLTGPGNRSYLIGCHITTNSADPPTAYQFTLPNITQVLSTSTGNTLPTSSFTFPAFEWDSNLFTVTVTNLAGPSGSFEGSWKTVPAGAEQTGEEDGTWTAQAGTGTGDDEPDAAKSTVA